MFDYNIHYNADNDEFNKVCEKIENNIDGLVKEEPIIDVDGSIIQIYLKDDHKIKVYNDYEVDAVYIESEIDISNII